MTKIKFNLPFQSYNREEDKLNAIFYEIEATGYIVNANDETVSLKLKTTPVFTSTGEKYNPYNFSKHFTIYKNTIIEPKLEQLEQEIKVGLDKRQKCFDDLKSKNLEFVNIKTTTTGDVYYRLIEIKNGKILKDKYIASEAKSPHRILKTIKFATDFYKTSYFVQKDNPFNIEYNEQDQPYIPINKVNENTFKYLTKNELENPFSVKNEKEDKLTEESQLIM